MHDRTDVKCNINSTDILDLLEKITASRFDEKHISQTMPEITNQLAECIGSSTCAVIINDIHEQNSEVFTSGDVEVTEHNPLIEKVLKEALSVADKTSVCVPIMAGEDIFGAIFAQTPAPIEDAQRIMHTAGQYIAMAIKNEQLAEIASQNERLAAAGKATLNLSHSVKNVLQMVSGAAEVIDLGLKTNQMDRVMRSWDILNPNLNRLRKFMLDMLTYSKERPLRVENCDFNKIIEDSIESLRAQLSKNTIPRIDFGIDRAVPEAEVDGEMILEMALNIILNAIEIVDPQNGVISVETHYLADEKAIELVVKDNGPGMDDETLEKLFVPFESKKAKLGTGLGMAIAKQIIDRHHGTIEVQTELGKGTTMSVRIPVDFRGF